MPSSGSSRTPTGSIAPCSARPRRPRETAALALRRLEEGVPGRLLLAAHRLEAGLPAAVERPVAEQVPEEDLDARVVTRDRDRLRQPRGLVLPARPVDRPVRRVRLVA